MLSIAKEKLVRSLHTKKGRQKSGLCLVEGQKVIDTAGSSVDWTFASADTPYFAELVTTDTPQPIAGVARIPQWTTAQITAARTVVVLDGVQDPGNVGAILRLCLGFDASLILIDSVDPSSSKVIRSSVGALFQVPWVSVKRADAVQTITDLNRPVFRLESGADAIVLQDVLSAKPCALIAGSEGNGITLDMPGQAVAIPHNPALESLNVAQAVAISLYQLYSVAKV